MKSMGEERAQSRGLDAIDEIDGIDVANVSIVRICITWQRLASGLMRWRWRNGTSNVRNFIGPRLSCHRPLCQTTSQRIH